MLCPRDGTSLKTVKQGEVEVDECSACGGVFLDRGELESIQSAVEKAGAKALDGSVDTVSEGFDSAQNEALPLIACIKCQAQMDRRRYGYGSQTVIDECAECGGLWLDGGELEALQKYFNAGSAETQLPILWRVWALVRGGAKAASKK